jgi:hypothetical protein
VTRADAAAGTASAATASRTSRPFFTRSRHFGWRPEPGVRSRRRHPPDAPSGLPRTNRRQRAGRRFRGDGGAAVGVPS